MLENLNLTIEDLKHPHILRVLFFNETTETVDIFKLSNYIETFVLDKRDRKENGVFHLDSTYKIVKYNYPLFLS